MSDQVKFELEQELLKLSSTIGGITDLAKLREHYIAATALLARIARLTREPPKSA